MITLEQLKAISEHAILSADNGMTRERVDYNSAYGFTINDGFGFSSPGRIIEIVSYENSEIVLKVQYNSNEPVIQKYNLYIPVPLKFDDAIDSIDVFGIPQKP